MIIMEYTHRNESNMYLHRAQTNIMIMFMNKQKLFKNKNKFFITSNKAHEQKYVRAKIAFDHYQAFFIFLCVNCGKYFFFLYQIEVFTLGWSIMKVLFEINVFQIRQVNNKSKHFICNAIGCYLSNDWIKQSEYIKIYFFQLH